MFFIMVSCKKRCIWINHLLLQSPGTYIILSPPFSIWTLHLSLSAWIECKIAKWYHIFFWTLVDKRSLSILDD
ncbi:hypothetical protein PHAVU_010G081800 [Phaseolus vulgaris]|uniref:Uncharacterized protein n=1 Tax=Phaseolus vulgaris TaxID=3885 RepID=V7AMK8_PHAVU|nr:hypothetical protein PHAVU_010G081800g [Phaseolus vulgaris]ESW06847.1 hypothetical protein PHAVU_010G081800g [Phaseolus vulgaris]